MFKKIISSASIVLILALSWTNIHATNYPSQFSTKTDPAKHIMDAVKKIKNFNSNSSNVPPKLVRGFLETEIIPLFDFDSMARWIVGPYVQYMSAGDQAQFYDNLKDTFLSSLSNHLGSFDAENTKIRYYPARYKFNGEAIVTTQVLRTGKYPARLAFRMKNDGYTWKIVDVKANGTSAVLYYRNHFINQLRQYGNQPTHNNRR